MANHLTMLDMQRLLKGKGKPLSRATIYRLIARDEFPKPVGVKGRKSVWSQDHIQVWLSFNDNVPRYRLFMAMALKREPL